MLPKRLGWYWFLPDEKCPSPTGLLRLDSPVVVLVGQCPYTDRLVVRFRPNVMMYVDDMSGDWEICKKPKSLQLVAMRRMKEKRDRG